MLFQSTVPQLFNNLKIAIYDADNQARKAEAAKRLNLYHDAQLSYLYANAKALLVPIRPNQKDIARFPHKIGEYLASSAPIITTAYGEIPNYFIDNYNAVIAKTYHIDCYAAKMKLVISNPALASKIGINGFQIGFKNFDYRILSHRMEAFFDNL